MKCILHRLLVAHASFAEHRTEQVALALADPPLQKPISEEVKPHLVGRTVGNVAGILLAPLGLWHLTLNATDLHAESFIERPHPVGVALGEIVVDGGQMGPFALERGEIQRQCGSQRFSLAGLHFDDRAEMHCRAAQQLDVEVPHIQLAAARLANQGKRFDQEPIERFAAAGSIAQRQAHFFKIVVALGHQPFFE
jgi:hypothetical protein